MSLLLSDKKIDGNVQILSIELPEKIISKLDVIGIYKGSIIKIIQSECTKNIIVFEINNIRYGIRVKDAKNIVVKKEIYNE